LAERDFPTNMIVLKSQDIDVTLGMNWFPAQSYSQH
jgi:hypothetical protein